jgi:hypothetical protein
LPNAENPEPSPAEHAPVDRSVNTTGALIAVLLLLTAHLQNTYETPFLSIFVLISGTRSFLKFLNLALKHSSQPDKFTLLKLAVLLIDTFAFVDVLELAVCTWTQQERVRQHLCRPPPPAMDSVFLFQVVESSPPSTPAP